VRLCIDASNLRAGGGLTHLVELLAHADAPAYGFDSVFIWSSRATLERIAERAWLVKRTAPVMERNFLWRADWQRRCLGALAATDGCDLIFVPGGAFATSFRPIVTMCRNMLPFEWREIRRYGLSLQAMRFVLLRLAQARSFRRASAVIFLTQYARDEVLGKIGRIRGSLELIPHGIDPRFFNDEAARPSAIDGRDIRPFEIVYVSIIDHYKHQTTAARAVAALADLGHPVHLTLIGPAYPPALQHLVRVLEQVDPRGKSVRYEGPIAHAELHAAYARADIGLFASSCENMPNILLEQMAAGLPIACSNRGPMPDILGDGGVFFDPENVQSVADAILALMGDPALRARAGRAAQIRARQYSWTRCAHETFAFLARIAAPQSGAVGNEP
jgi:glycosyltransferase involved in cell wall biosynthesis